MTGNGKTNEFDSFDFFDLTAADESNTSKSPRSFLRPKMSIVNRLWMGPNNRNDGEPCLACSVDVPPPYELPLNRGSCHSRIRIVPDHT